MIRLYTSLLLAGCISATGFAPLHLWPLALLCWGWLAHRVHGAISRRQALAMGYWFAVGHFIVGLNWIAGAFRYQDAMPVWLGWVAVVVLAFYIAIYPALAAGLAWVWGRGRPLIFILFYAAAWILTEWLRARVFTGFAWNPLAVLLVEPGLAGSSRMVGTYGVSGLVLLMAGALWLAALRRWKEAAGLGLVLLLAILITLPDGPQPPNARQPLIRIVQPNIAQQDKHDENFNAVNFARLEAQMGGRSNEPRLIFWPEAAIPEHIGEEDAEAANTRARIATLMGPDDLLLTGNDKIFSERFERDGLIYERWVGAANSVFAMNARGEILGRYDKAHLVPYGEYLPMRAALSAIGLSRLVPGDLDFWPGPGPQTLSLAPFGNVGVQICYEIIFSGEVIDAANRPTMLFNPSNDAWFGSWGPPQHLAQARLRALEEAIPVIRSTPTGISAVIDARGHVLNALPYQQAGAIQTRLPSPAAATPFASYGNILSFALAFFLVLAGIALDRRVR